MKRRYNKYLSSSAYCFIGLILMLCNVTIVSAQQISGRCRVTLIGAAQSEQATNGSIEVKDDQGNSSGVIPDENGFVSTESVPDVDVFNIGSKAYLFIAKRAHAWTFSWRAAENPSMVSVICKTNEVPDTVYRYYRIEANIGNILQLSEDVSGTWQLRRDSNGDGVVDIDVAPDVLLTGSAAEDVSRPTITHHITADGFQELTLFDESQQLVNGQLSFSIDGGNRFSKYLNPVALNPDASPQIFAIGRDAAGNESAVYTFFTRGENRNFCDRVQTDRTNLISIMQEGVAAAKNAGELQQNQNVVTLATGHGACLWRRDTQGQDLSCELCSGHYRPAVDTQQIKLIFPDTISESAREQVRDRLRSLAAESRYIQSRITFESLTSTSFLTAQLPPVNFGLGAQSTLLDWLLTGEYVVGNGADFSGMDLEITLGNLVVPALEGFELVKDSERNLLVSDVLVRVVGMNSGLKPSQPQLDPYLERLLRKQLDIAAQGVLRSATGLMIANDCAIQNGALLTDRQKFVSNACNGQACRSFPHFVASRAQSLTVSCPDLFSAVEIGFVEKAAEIRDELLVPLSTLMADECASNEFLAQTLAFLTPINALTQSIYDTGMNDLLLIDPALHAVRSTNRNKADSEIIAKRAKSGIDVKLSLSNIGTNAMNGVKVRMYEDNILNGQELTVSVESNHVAILQGERQNNSAFFINLDLDNTIANVLHAVSFLLTTPGQNNSASEAQTFGGFSFYTFDPNNPICPTPAAVVKPSE